MTTRLLGSHHPNPTPISAQERQKGEKFAIIMSLS